MRRSFCLILLSLLAASPLWAQITGQYYTSFDGTKIHYEVRGDKGPAVLLIHGFIVNSSTWKKAALPDSLLAHGFRVITLDLRGNGLSDHPHDSSAYAHDAEAKDIMGLLHALHIRSYDVLGYSRGSIIAARLLVLDKRVHKAVLGGMGIDFTNPQWPRRIMFYHALRGDSVPELAGMIQYVTTAGLDRQALACMQQEQPSTPVAALQQVKQPVLVIRGKDDVDNGSAPDLAKVFPHGTLITSVPGDHNHAASTPEFAAAVVGFLQ